MILDLIVKSRTLIELDVSWNRLNPPDLVELFKILSRNRQLQVLNISWNNIQNPVVVDPQTVFEKKKARE